MRNHKAGYVELILLGVLWGSIGVLVDKVRVGSPVIAEVRLAVGCLAAVGFYAARGRIKDLRLRDQRRLLVFDGVLVAVHWALMFEAFKRLSVGAAILIVFIGPVFVAAAARRVLGERVERRTVAALGLSLGGMVLIALPAWDVGDPLGVVFALLSAVGFAGLLLAGKRLTRSYPAPAILVWQLGIGAVAMLPVAAVADLSGLSNALPALLTLAVVHTAFAGVVYFGALTVVKAQHVGVLTYLEPATAILYAWLFLSESPGLWTIAGGALILAGGLIVVFGSSGAAGSPEEPVAPAAEVRASLRP